MSRGPQASPPNGPVQLASEIKDGEQGGGQPDGRPPVAGWGAPGKERDTARSHRNQQTRRRRPEGQDAAVGSHEQVPEELDAFRQGGTGLPDAP